MSVLIESLVTHEAFLVDYDRLIIAIGASPVIPPIKNVNLNNVRSSYTPSLKKDDSKSKQVQEEFLPTEVLQDGTNAAEAYGRVLVSQSGKIDNPETVKCVKDSVDFFINNPELASAALKASDDALSEYGLDGIADANATYEDTKKDAEADGFTCK